MKHNFFKIFIILIIIIFLFLVYSGQSGYYEYKLSKDVSLTNDAIKQFEDDIKNGKEIITNNYIDLKEKDYSNTFTKVGNKLSNVLNTSISKCFKYLFNYINDQIK